jgi:hypothetical protein
MSLPTYNRNNRRKTFEPLPKDAYVVRILSAKTAETKSGFNQLVIAFDIAEGQYKDFYKAQYDANSSEDKKWPNDAVFRLTIPHDGCQDYVVTNWDSFFADLEDSNSGFVFNGDEKTLKGKLIGAKMHIEQSEYNGEVYDHTRMKWTCVADDVRNGKAGRLPNDKLIAGSSGSNRSAADSYANSGFSGTDDEELPFD